MRHLGSSQQDAQALFRRQRATAKQPAQLRQNVMQVFNAAAQPRGLRLQPARPSPPSASDLLSAPDQVNKLGKQPKRGKQQRELFEKVPPGHWRNCTQKQWQSHALLTGTRGSMAPKALAVLLLHQS